MFMFHALTFIALVGSASASLFSAGCTTALMNVASNPEATKCLNPSMLLPIVIGAGNGQDSMIPFVDNWVTGMCAMPACSSDTLSAVVNNITAGCSNELGLPPKEQASQTVAVVQKYYATARKVLCLKDGDTMCATRTLNALQGATGTMILDQKNFNDIALLGQFGYTANITCTDCMHGAWTIINQDVPGTIPPARLQLASDVCGPSFVDGGIPPGLLQTAFGSGVGGGGGSNSTTPAASPTKAAAVPTASKKSGALGRPSSGMACISFIILISTVFSFVA